MPLPLKVSEKRAPPLFGLSLGLSENGAQSSVGLKPSLLSKRSAFPSLAMDDDDEFWESEEVLAPLITKPRANDILKTVIKKKQQKAEGVHHAKRELKAAVEDDSEDEDAELPITASQEVLEENCKKIEQTAADMGHEGIQAPAWSEAVLCATKGILISPVVDVEFEAVAAAVLQPSPHFDSVPTTANVFERTLLSGSLQQLCLRRRAATEALMRPLFECTYLHENSVISSAAFRCLSNILGASEFDQGLHRHGALKRRWASPLHVPRPKISVEWSPSLDDYSAALTACGVTVKVSTSDTGGKRGKGSASKGKEASGSKEAPSKSLATDSSLVRLKLVLRLLTIHCSSRECQFDDAIILLLPTLLRLHLDPAAAVYYQDLQTTVPSMLSAVSESQWDKVSRTLAAEIAALGPSHMSAVKLLQTLPVSSNRGADLQRMGALVALERVLGSRPRSKKRKYGKGRNECGNPGAGELLHALHSLGDAAAMAKAALKANSSEEWNFWSIISTVQLVDMLMWMPAKNCAEATLSQEDDPEEADAIRSWADFLQALGRNVRTITQDESQNRAKLLISEVSSYYDFIRRKGFL